MNKSLLSAIILLFLPIQAIAQDTNLISGVVDFLDINAGEIAHFKFRETNSNDFRSKLPYHFFEVPLPKNTIVNPAISFRVSINKESSILHSKSIELVLPEQSCSSETERYKRLFRVHGFVDSKQIQGETPNSATGLVNQEQILTISCHTSGSSPYFTLEIKVTTAKEHQKFETIMSNFRG